MARFADKKIVVTGGSGFLGGALIKALAQEGAQVVSLSRRLPGGFEPLRVKALQYDLSQDDGQLASILAGADAVIHAAAKVDMWGRYKDFYAANVTATQRLLEACVISGVKRFVFTSSPSVVADGKDLRGVNENYPYPQKYLAHYPMTKAMAEGLVLAADSQGGLRTLALRPHLIFGPGDTNLIPTILAKAKAGRLLRVGQGQNRTDLTFIDDCVQAHLNALDALKLKPDECAGRPYFISQGEPVNMWSWIDQVLQLNGFAPISRSINSTAAFAIAAACESVCSMLPGKPEPFLTRFLVCEMSTSHYFDISAAKAAIGYAPKFSISQAMQRTFHLDARPALLKQPST